MKYGAKLALLPLLAMAVAVPAAAAAVQAEAGPATAVQFNIRAGELLDALTAFQNQAGLPPTGITGAAIGKRTEGVSGNLPPREALEKLLGGTGLTFLERNDGGYNIEPLTAVRMPGGRCTLDRRKQKCRED